MQASTLWATSPPLAPLAAAADPTCLTPMNTTAPPNTSAALAPGAGPRPAAVKAQDIARSGVTLMLAKLCLHMEQNSVPWVMERVAGAFALRGAPGLASANRADLPPAFVPGEVGGVLRGGAGVLGRREEGAAASSATCGGWGQRSWLDGGRSCSMSGVLTDPRAPHTNLTHCWLRLSCRHVTRFSSALP